MGKEQYSVAYVTNMMIHYTQNLCQEFIRNKNVSSFHLIVSEAMSDEYAKMGVEGNTGTEEYVIDATKHSEEAKKIIDESDVVLGQYYGMELLRERIKTNKITFIVSERIFKRYDAPLVNLTKNFIRWFKYKNIIGSNNLNNDNAQDLIRLDDESTPDHHAPYSLMPILKDQDATALMERIKGLKNCNVRAFALFLSGHFLLSYSLGSDFTDRFKEDCDTLRSLKVLTDREVEDVCGIRKWAFQYLQKVLNGCIQRCEGKRGAMMEYM